MTVMSLKSLSLDVDVIFQSLYVTFLIIKTRLGIRNEVQYCINHEL